MLFAYSHPSTKSRYKDKTQSHNFSLLALSPGQLINLLPTLYRDTHLGNLSSTQPAKSVLPGPVIKIKRHRTTSFFQVLLPGQFPDFYQLCTATLS